MPNETIAELLSQPPFDACGSDDLFLQAADTCLQELVHRFPRYAEFVAVRTGRDPNTPLATWEQLERLPSLFLPVLKGIQFDVPPDLQITQRLTSSGTSGIPSCVPLDQVNMQRRVAAMLSVYEALRIVTGPTTAVAFLMDPATTQMAGSVVIDAVLKAHPDVTATHYLARMTAGAPAFDHEAASRILQTAAEQGSVLAVGYPALIVAAIRQLQAAGLDYLPLPHGSRVLTGGGWKSFLPGVQIDQREFRSIASDYFHIEPAAIRDMFGLSECPAVFVQCQQGQYHVPRFARAEAINPETQTRTAPGTPGLLQLTVPLTTSYPLLKILTTDKCEIHNACPCGIPSPVLIPRGRTTAARFETCAMQIGQAVP